MKRLMDIIVSIFLLIFLSPLILILAVCVYYFLGSPILFSQQRPGKNGQPFTIFKFRTMLNLTNRQGELLSDEIRITRFGKFLRNSSLDELPELLNVLNGSMSLVGPRPLMMEYLSRYSPEQHRRHHVLPGITGLAQVSGRNALAWREKFKLDVWYVDHWSIWLDCKILSKTLYKVLSREGINEDGFATASEFMGNSEVE